MEVVYIKQEYNIEDDLNEERNDSINVNNIKDETSKTDVNLTHVQLNDIKTEDIDIKTECVYENCEHFLNKNDVGLEITGSSDDPFEIKTKIENLDSPEQNSNKSEDLSRIHICEICQTACNDLNTLELHKKIHAGTKSYLKEKSNDNVQNQYLCVICNKLFKSLNSIKTHIRIHTGERPFKCNICGKKFIQASARVIHMRTHTENMRYECSVCNMKFSLPNVLNAHRKIHIYERRFECNICRKKFIDLENLNLHTEIHTREYRYKCSVCNMNFKQSDDLSTHMGIHTDERQCSICNKIFNGANVYKAHMESHSEENPSACNIKIIQQPVIYTPKKIHSDEKSFKCSISNKKLRLSKNLTHHMKTHSDKRPVRPSSLISHMKKHNEDKLREWELCYQKFIKKYELKKNMLIYGDIQYECFICKSKFKTETSMAMHITMYHTYNTGNLCTSDTFKCDICTKHFNSAFNLYQHKLTH